MYYTSKESSLQISIFQGDPPSSGNLWFYVNNRLNNIESVAVDLTCKDIILGCDIEQENCMINNVIVNVKMYIWRSKLIDILPTYLKLKEWIYKRTILEKQLEQFL